jgi:hypothetical protein
MFFPNNVSEGGIPIFLRSCAEVVCPVREVFPDGGASVAVMERLLERSDFDGMIATLAWVKMGVVMGMERSGRDITTTIKRGGRGKRGAQRANEVRLRSFLYRANKVVRHWREVFPRWGSKGGGD